MQELEKNLGQLYTAIDRVRALSKRVGLPVHITLDTPAPRTSRLPKQKPRTERLMKPSTWKYPWNDVDWTKFNRQIAQELGATDQLVAYWRDRLNKPKLEEDGRATSPNVFKGWDKAPFQAKVMSEVLTMPGMSALEYANHMNKENGQAHAVYHSLRSLTRKGAVRRAKAGGVYRYFPHEWERYGGQDALLEAAAK